MNSSSTTALSRPSFWKSLLNRRFPQIIGTYLVGSWALLQFIDWIVKRYLLSPYWVDLCLLLLLLLLPSIMLVAWYHGRPGPDRWRKIEVVGIPLNVILTLAVLFFSFRDKSMGATATAVSTLDDAGQEIERLVPTSAFRKNISILCFENKSGDVELDFWQSGLSLNMGLDLVQDMYLNVNSGAPVLMLMRRLGYESVQTLPLKAQKELASELHSEYFCSGEYAFTDGIYKLTVRLHQTVNGKLLKSRQFEGPDMFDLIDQATLQLRKDLDIPQYHIDAFVDLPIAEITTSSEKAAADYFRGVESAYMHTDYNTATSLMEKSVAADPDFTMALFQLSQMNGITGKQDLMMQQMRSVVENIDKLPERIQFLAKSIWYLVSESNEKRLKILNMWVDLYPEDLLAHKSLAQAFELAGNNRAAIEEYETIRTIDEQGGEVLLTLAKLLATSGDFEKAKSYYFQYRDTYEKGEMDFSTMGLLHLRSGQYDEAIEQLEKALLLDPLDVGDQCRLGRAQMYVGNFETAERMYVNALGSCRSDMDSGRVYENLESYYKTTGQIEKALQAIEVKLELYSHYQMPLNMAFYRIDKLQYLMLLGRYEEARSILDQVTEAYTGLYDDVDGFAEVIYYYHINQPSELRLAIDKIVHYVERFGHFNNQVIIWEAMLAALEGNPKKSIGPFKAYIEDNAGNTSSERALLAELYRLDNQFDAAREQLEIGLSFLPKSPRLLFELARLERETANEDKAREALTTLLEIWSKADRNFVYYREAVELAESLQMTVPDSGLPVN